MKIIAIFFAAVLTISCAQNSSQNDSSKSVVEISPVSNQRVENDLSTPDFIDASNSDNTPDFIKTSSAHFGLSDLENLKLSKDDLEIRLWHFSGLGMPLYEDSGVKKSVFVLTRSSGVWFAEIIRETVKYNKKDRTEIKKTFSTKLNEPKSGWDNVWLQLVSEEILTLPNGEDVGVLPGFDTGYTVVQTKDRGIYRFYEYAGTYYSYDKEKGLILIREAVQMAKIANVIADEFNILDLEVKVPQMEGHKF